VTRSAPAWVSEAVFYQIFPDRFRRSAGTWPEDGSGATRSTCGGDLDGVRQALPYLEDLGITALYLTPIFPANTIVSRLSFLIKTFFKAIRPLMRRVIFSTLTGSSLLMK
jgi:hypothetical protein